MIKFNAIQEWLDKSSESAKHRLIQSIKFVFIIGLFIGLFSIIPIADVFQVIKKANPALLLIGIALGLPKIYINSVMLGLITRKQGLAISNNRLFIVNMMVKFYMLFLPGAIIGSGIRWAKISPEGKSAEALAAVAFSRFLEIFLIIVTGLFWFLAGINQENFNVFSLLIFILGIVFAWLIFVKLSHYFAKWFENTPTFVTKHSKWQIIWNYLKKIFQSLNVYTEFSIKELVQLISIGILSYFVGLASFIFIARSTGIFISIFDLGWIRSVILLASYTPISIAGGLGIREVSLVVLFSLFGVDAEIALAFSLLLFTRTITLSLIGGIFELGETIQKRKVV
jgi:uncharacterized protein (TIRG00374 family)